MCQEDSREYIRFREKESPEQKSCSTCKKPKPVDEFHKRSASKDGLSYKCKSCAKQYSDENKIQRRKHAKEWYERRKDHAKENQRSWADRNREKVYAYQAKRRTKKQGTLTTWDFDVSAAYRKAITNDPCAYCGETEGVFHVDHVFPISKGGDDRWYNLTRACESCNLSKSARCGTAFRLLRGNP